MTSSMRGGHAASKAVRLYYREIQREARGHRGRRRVENFRPDGGLGLLPGQKQTFAMPRSGVWRR
jgi:hypothetical protein